MENGTETRLDLGVWVVTFSNRGLTPLHEKKLLFKKKIKYVKPFTKDRMLDQSKNQVWKMTTIIQLLRYFNTFNLKAILAKKKKEAVPFTSDQCRI